MKTPIIALSLGTFFGNWIFVPLFSGQTFKEGFYIGLTTTVLLFTAFGVTFLWQKFLQSKRRH